MKVPFKENLRIAVVGAGAIGCYYGGKLAASGCDVTFLMRSDLEAVREKGLTITSTDDPPVTLPPGSVKVAGTPGEIGPVDLILIGLKTTANHAFETLIPPLLHESTAILTFQNGLGNEARLGELFGGERVMGGLCFVCLNRVAPGVIEHYGHGTVSIGEYEGEPHERTHQLAGLLRKAGIEVDVVESLLEERWRKLVWNIPFNGLSIAAGGVTTDRVIADEGLHGLARALMEETIAIAAACGHEIEASYADYQFERTVPMGAYKPSSLIDYWENRPVEVEAIWGAPLREARRAGIEAGRLELLYGLIRWLVAARVGG